MPRSCHENRTVCIRLLRYIAALLAMPAWSQPPQPEIERQLLLRDQQQHELLLKQRQSQELLDPRLTATQRLEIERRQFQQRQQQRRLHERQAQRQVETHQAPQPAPESERQGLLDVQRRQFDNERQEQLDRFKYEARERPSPAAADP